MYELIRVTGHDAAGFLQGQFTQDLGRLAECGSLPFAYCDSAGRVLATGRLLDLKGAVGVAVADGMASVVVDRLTKYRLRAAVRFELAGGAWRALAVAGPGLPERLAAAGPGAPSDPVHRVELIADPPVVELYAPAAALERLQLPADAALPAAGWRRARIVAGLVDIDAGTSGLYTAHMLNLDRTGTVSFDKGCYSGQEIIARTEHRGQSRRRTFRFRCLAENIRAGERLFLGDAEVGSVVNVSGYDLLAVVPRDLADRELSIRDQPAVRAPLPYAV